MVKRLILTGLSLGLAVMMAPAVSSAQSNFDANVGCGLGNILLKEKDTSVFQALAVTTNGLFGNQTFGISSGTLGCKQPSRFVKDERLKKFVAENMDTLAQDMSKGSGESLSTLAELMKVPAEKRVGFYSTLQANFTKIYTSGTVQSAEVIDNISKVALDS